MTDSACQWQAERLLVFHALELLLTSSCCLGIDNDYEERRNNGVKMDWLGAGTTITGLVLFVFAITDSAHASNGWSTPYILVTFILGIVILGVAFYVEGWVAEQPLLPFEAFKIK